MNKIIIFIREHKSVILFIIGLLIAASAFFHSLYIEDKIKKMKAEATATVFYSDQETHRGGNVWRSRGVFYVNGKGYTYTIEDVVVPLGTRFKVYYLPSNPNKSLLANPNEFDHYPSWKDTKKE